MKTAELPIEEIIFENRNKEYGAYMLRKSYPKSISRALVYSASFMALLLVSPLIYGEFYPKEMEMLKNSLHILTDLTPPPEIDKIAVPPPPNLPPPEMPKVQSTAVAIPEPEVDETLVTDEPTKNVDIKGAISHVTQDGVDNPTELPLDISENGGGNDIVEVKEEPIFITVEQSPVFIGGLEELGRFLSKNLRYPRQAVQQGIEGKVYVQFVVGRDGKVSQISVLKGIGFGCDEEAMRVVSMMPTWTAGKQGGKPVSVRYNLPISFKLQK